MDQYAQILNIAIPIFIGLVAFEWFISRIMGREVVQGMDAISSLSSGITNIIKDVLGLSVIILSYSFFVKHLAIIEIPQSIWVYIVCFIGLDFAGYWSHRFEHSINIFWNRHIVHHSSEEFNLACALRQPVSNIVKVFFFLLIPLAVLGIPTEVIAIMAPLHLFAQFWYHTRLIGKMGFLEKIIVTPSHHRVHHAINEEYIDKNYAPIFIVWDKWFGTFQEELDEVPPVYGVKRPVRTWNPFIINFQHFVLLLQDAWRTKSWKDKLSLWFRPTGYRPADVQEQYPVQVIDNVYNFQKYKTEVNRWELIWFWFQLLTITVFMMYLFNQIASFSFSNILIYAGFLMISIFALTSSMDKSKWAIIPEVLKIGLGITILFQFGSWFGINEFIAVGSYLVAFYLILSFLITTYLVAFRAKRVELA